MISNNMVEFEQELAPSWGNHWAGDSSCHSGEFRNNQNTYLRLSISTIFSPPNVTTKGVRYRKVIREWYLKF